MIVASPDDCAAKARVRGDRGRVVTIVGDVRLEVRARIDQTFASIVSDYFSFSSVGVHVSGTAMNVANAAQTFFSDVHVIARIGHDAVTPVIERAAEESVGCWHLVVDDNRGNPPVIIVRDASTAQPGGARLLISGTRPPCFELTTADIDMHRRIVEMSRVLFVDGYTLLAQPARDATLHAMRIARRSGTSVCLDLVPHDLDGFLSASEILGAVGIATHVVSEANTLSRILGLGGEKYPFLYRHLSPLLSSLDSLSLRPTWLLRYGDGGISETVVYRDGAIMERRETGYGEAVDKTGFGDRLTVEELYRLG